MTQVNAERSEPIKRALSRPGHARGILELSEVEIVEPPSLIEEKLLKTEGIFSAEVNVFSRRITVEFDPSAIGLEAIRKIISRRTLS